jgi:F0F1-type ATP synthase epsilon subunit
MSEPMHQEQKIDDSLLFVTVKSPIFVHFKGPAIAVTSFNHTGKFDVLALHASFISLIQDSVIIYKPNNQGISIKINTGVMKVFKNNVQVFIGIEIRK